MEFHRMYRPACVCVCVCVYIYIYIYAKICKCSNDSSSHSCPLVKRWVIYRRQMFQCFVGCRDDGDRLDTIIALFGIKYDVVTIWQYICHHLRMERTLLIHDYSVYFFLNLVQWLQHIKWKPKGAIIWPSFHTQTQRALLASALSNCNIKVITCSQI